MISYIIRRLLLLFPTLIGITAVTFFTMALSPGGIATAALSQEGQLKPSERRAMEEYYNRRYGLNKPIAVQYLNWLNKVSPIGGKESGSGFPASWHVGFKTPDLGDSFSKHRPVADLLAEALPITLLLNVLSVPLIYGIALLSGIRAARRRGQFEDVATGTLFLGMWSFPSILAGVLLIGYLANRETVTRFVHIFHSSDQTYVLFPTGGLHDQLADQMNFLPTVDQAGFHRGWLLDCIWHLALPVICLSYGSFAFVAKLSRAAILENISSDYVRTARAKGASENQVLYRHALRNSLLPVITLAATILPGLLAGSIIVETIFNLQGMGKLTVDAVFARDRELVLTDTLIAGLLGLLAYLIADISYAIADPRVSYE
jgi:ABC-type dipeptide/oligopeptide/nickel transport system permease component